MKVKKYVGDTMQDTIFKVKADLGPDAIILNTRKFKKRGFLGIFSKKQVEVLAALEEKKENSRTLQEISELKQIVKEMNKNWHLEKKFNDLPEEIVILINHLRSQGIEEDIVQKFVAKFKDEYENNEDNNNEDIVEMFKEEISKFLSECQPITVGNKRKVIAFVGPTGVGKTTTIAKLAAHFSLDEGRKVGLITTDTYRIAAVQQLQTYSDIINIPLQVVYNEDDLDDLVEEHYKDYDLVLIDTAGSSTNNKIQLGRLKKLAKHSTIDEIHLIISLNIKSKDIKDIIDKFSILKPDKILLTKLDETLSYGDIINIKKNYNLPYSYITFGQNVPDDIREAEADNLINYIMGGFYE